MEGSSKYKVGIIGTGFVGSAVSTGLETILKSSVSILEYDKYKDTESLETVVEESNILFLCVPTPTNITTGECNLSIIESVCREINNLAKKRKIIVVKSTVPPGTTERLQKIYKNHSFIFNPEFLTEQNFINDFLNQDRILLGYTEKCHKHDLDKVKAMYRNFTEKQETPGKIYECDSKEAEMVKYSANCFLATKLMFFNEIYQICQASKIDYNKVKELVTLDHRVGTSHTTVPGPDGQMGFSKSCFPKDINALINYSKSIDVDPMLLESVWSKNLMTREDHDWERLPQFSGEYSKKG